MDKRIFRYFLSIFVISTILSSVFIIAEDVSAVDNAPKGFEPYYMRGYTFNVPESFKRTDDGYDNVNHLKYMNFKKGKKFVNISLDEHSEFTKNQMDIYSLFTWNGLDHYKTSIAGVRNYRQHHDREYDFDDDAYYESDVYDDSFDDSFDDASYYNYNW